MAVSHTDVQHTIRAFLVRANKPVEELGDDTHLFADGIGLDSLEAAELSAILEDEYGRDPFTSDTMPRTVGELIHFYDAVVAEV